MCDHLHHLWSELNLLTFLHVNGLNYNVLYLYNYSPQAQRVCEGGLSGPMTLRSCFMTSSADSI